MKQAWPKFPPVPKSMRACGLVAIKREGGKVLADVDVSGRKRKRAQPKGGVGNDWMKLPIPKNMSRARGFRGSM